MCLQAVGNDLISALSTIEALQSKLQVLCDDWENESEALFEAAKVGVTSEEMSHVARALRLVYRPNAGAADQVYVKPLNCDCGSVLVTIRRNIF